MPGHGVRDLLERQEGEELQVALDVPVVGVEPELIEMVGAGPLGIEPDVPRLTLAELGPARGGDQGEDEAVDLTALAPVH
jgi:hypothetical protein